MVQITRALEGFERGELVKVRPGGSSEIVVLTEALQRMTAEAQRRNLGAQRRNRRAQPHCRDAEQHHSQHGRPGDDHRRQSAGWCSTTSPPPNCSARRPTSAIRRLIAASRASIRTA
ncbi:MAG: hypothetical protein MZV49_15780 [Rhodopseudomonas palustris]|nr:hypothetical protein [Rhodopseudomonas palustris]